MGVEATGQGEAVASTSHSHVSCGPKTERPADQLLKETKQETEWT